MRRQPGAGMSGGSPNGRAFYGSATIRALNITMLMGTTMATPPAATRSDIEALNEHETSC
jgi:hypothetical protein